MKNQRKFKTLFKRLISGVSAVALSVGLLGSIPASADDSTIGYKYTLFAYSSEEGAISSSAANFCVNGNIATNGTISADQNFNVNGEKKEHTNEAMPDLTKAITEKFFAENVDVKAENYKNEDVNINVLAPLDVKGKAEFMGNIKLAAGVKAMGDISFAGGVLNNENTVLFSEKGNIVINSENVSLTGLIYAPKGNIVIESKSLNLNSVVMIANKITFNAPNVNINNSASMAKFVQEAIDKNGSSGGNEDPEPVTDPAIYAYGEYNEETKSVDIEWYSNVTGEFAVLESLNGTDYSVVSKVSNDTKCSIKVTSDFIKKYFKVATIKDGKTIESIPFSIVNANGKYTTELLDTDKDGLADLYEEMLGTDKTVPDTDKDGLTDYEEAYITSTDPTKYDSVTDGVSDANADNDKDGLTNKKEIELKTDPNSDDTDEDNLKDGDEVSKYNTDPLKPDTDEDDLEDDDEFKFNCDPNKKDTDNNGIIDGKEKHQQSYDFVPDNKEQAVTKVSVSMAATGNIEKTTMVESIMNKDVLCSNVVGLVGEPFSIESESSFDKATITFTVDKTKLGETEFDNLIFLWYDRENDNFVELETSHNAVNSTVSIETTHFSDYMIVDSEKWWNNWREINNDIQKYSSGTPKTSSRAVSLVFQCTSNGDPDFINPDPDDTMMSHHTNYRTLISDYLIASMSESDVLSFVNMYQTGYASSGFSGDKDRLKDSIEPYINQIFKSTSYSYNAYRDSTLGLYVLSTEIKRECPDKETKSIVYITDHDVFIDDVALRNRYPNISPDIGKDYKSVPVYFVCIGEFDRTNLKKVADETNGKVYTAATLNELYSELNPSLIFPEAKDTDKDRFSDDEETYGLIVDSSGTRYKTDPKSKHSDNDGLEDNKEIEVSRVSVETKDDKGNTVWKCYHHMKSNPLKDDSDGDGLDDSKETNGFYYESINGEQKHCAGDPLHIGIAGGYCGELAIISCTNGLGGHAFLVYHSFIDDTLDFRGFTKGYDYTTWLPSEPRLYEIESFEYVALGNAGNNATASSSHSQLSEFESTGNDCDDAGIYFNREFAHEKNHYDEKYDINCPEKYKQEYDENYAISKLIKKQELDTVITTLSSRNWYSLTENNCAFVAVKAWNAIYGDGYFDIKRFFSDDSLDFYDYMYMLLMPAQGLTFNIIKKYKAFSPSGLKDQIAENPNSFVFNMHKVLGLE